MDKNTIEKIINETEVNQYTTINDNNTAFVIENKKNEHQLIVTIPFDVYEIFIHIFNFAGEKLYDDWRDYYGKTKDNDYEEDLKILCNIIKKHPIRVNKDGDTFEYFEYFENSWLIF